MMKILFIALMSLAALQSKEGYARSISETLEVAPGQRLQLQSDVGQVEVTGYAGSEVIVTVEIKGLDEDEFKVGIEKDAAGVRIEGELTRNKHFRGFSHTRVHFNIRVPREFDIKLQTSGGSISVTNVTGSVDTRTSGGSLVFEDITGGIVGHTSGGSVSASSIDGNMDLSTSGGSFKVHDVMGDVDLQTSGGSISLEKVSGEINASTSGGSITARFEESLSKDCDLQTSGGSVTAYLPKSSSVNLDADSSGGRVKSDFTVDGFQDKHSARGKINGGGPQLRLNSSGGGVRIRET